MAYELDPEIAPVLAAVLEQSAGLPVVARDDWKTLRERGNSGQAYLASLVPSSPDVQLTSFSTMTQDSRPIELRWYTRKNATPGSAVVYVHGGGMILGNLDLYDGVVSAYVTATGVPFLSVNYRLAPEGHDTTLAETAAWWPAAMLSVSGRRALSTSGPTSSTMPIHSCPICQPGV